MHNLHKLTNKTTTQQQPQTQKNTKKQAVSNADLSQNRPDHWSDQALCRGRGEWMFPREHKDLSYIGEARRLCRGCPVRLECLEYALLFPASDQHGVWAGFTPRQLAAEQRLRGVGAVRFTLAQVWGQFGG